MKKILLITPLLFVFHLSFTQEIFEGKVTYSSSFKSNSEKIDSKKYSQMMGTNQEYYIKNNNYKSIFNGSTMEWMIYNGDENKIYLKTSYSKEAIVSNGNQKSDSILSFSINKKVETILGYTCDELVVKTQTGTQKYYYNSSLKIDAELFKNHTKENWYTITKITQAIPLKMILETEQFTMTSIAINVEKIHLDDSIFELPNGIKTIKSSY